MDPDRKLTGIALVGLILGMIAGAYLLLTGQGLPAADPTAAPALTPTPTAAPRLPTPTPTHALPLAIPPLPGEEPESGSPTLPNVGDPAPGFTLKTLDGDSLSLSDFAGKVVWLNFWATWCPPCKDEMPAIQAVYEQYRDQGLVVLGIDDTRTEALSDIRPFVEGLKLTFPILLDEQGELNDRLYGVPGLPESFFIGRDGKVAQIKIGPLQKDQMEEIVQGLLK